MKLPQSVLDQIEAARREGRVTETGPADRLPPEYCAAVSEKEFMWKVISFAEDHGWTYWHVWVAQGSPAGLLDLILVRERVVWMELKTEKGRLTARQQFWIDRLLAAKQEVHVVRSSDWSEVCRILA